MKVRMRLQDAVLLLIESGSPLAYEAVPSGRDRLQRFRESILRKNGIKDMDAIVDRSGYYPRLRGRFKIITRSNDRGEGFG
jgi:hypothetical protein